jgi:hypothetical protein
VRGVVASTTAVATQYVDVTAHLTPHARMSTLTKLKLALAVIGIILFLAGVRFDDTRLRVIGIVFVAAAWIVRFVKVRDSVDRSG